MAWRDPTRGYAGALGYGVIDRVTIGLLWANAVALLLVLGLHTVAPSAWHVTPAAHRHPPGFALALLAVGAAGLAVVLRIPRTPRWHSAWRLAAVGLLSLDVTLLILAAGDEVLHFYFLIIAGYAAIYSDWRLGWIVAAVGLGLHSVGQQWHVPEEASLSLAHMVAPLMMSLCTTTLSILHVRSVRLAEDARAALAVSVAERDRTEAELAEARELAAKNARVASLGALVAGVAHEVNNPLAYMLLHQENAQARLREALLEPDLPQGAREALAEVAEDQAAILSGIGSITAVTQRLKRATRASQAPRSLVDVNVVVKDVVAVVGPHLMERVELKAALDARRPVSAIGMELGQVVLNLILNAAEALQPRGRGTIVARTRDEGGAVVVEVEDDGPGIAPDVQAHVFEPFFTTKPTGTGLGLPVSYRIVKDHGGELTFASEPGARTTFRIRLPAAAPDAAAPAIRPAGSA